MGIDSTVRLSGHHDMVRQSTIWACFAVLTQISLECYQYLNKMVNCCVALPRGAMGLSAVL